MTKILSIINQKGGVSKTTSTIGIGSSLAALSKRVLIVDFDPQGNASERLGRPSETPNVNDALLNPKGVKAEDVIYQATGEGDPIDNLYILPTSRDRQLAKTAEIMFQELRREQIFSKFVRNNADYLKNFDFIIIDTNPALNVLTINAMLASDNVVIPVTTSRDSFRAANDVVETLMEIMDIDDPSEVNYKILRCNINKSESSLVELTETLASVHGENQFSTYISKDASLPKAESRSTTMLKAYPNSKATNDYMQISKELMEWLNQ